MDRSNSNTAHKFYYGGDDNNLALRINCLFVNNLSTRITLNDYLNDFMMAYLNDILIYLKTREEHEGYIKKVL